MEKLGYLKIFESKILRVKHKITFRIGMDAFNLIEILKQVPGKAEIDEVIVDDEEERASIEFHEERLDE